MFGMRICEVRRYILCKCAMQKFSNLAIAFLILMSKLQNASITEGLLVVLERNWRVAQFNTARLLTNANHENMLYFLISDKYFRSY